MSFDVVLLDFDGTLADTHNAILASVEKMFADWNRSPIDRARVRAGIAMGRPLDESIRLFDPTLNEAEVAEGMTRYRAAYAEIGDAHTVLYPGVRETLRTLHQGGALMAILSNKGRPAIERLLASAALSAFIDLIFAAEDGMPSKPDAAVFDRRVAPAFPNLHRENFLMVGDTASDMRFARNAGLACCWAAYGYGDATACRDMRPDFEIADFAALTSLLA